MSKVHRRCCGMDVHKDTVVVCVLPPDGEEGEKIRKVFGTFRNEISRMRGWMKLKKITHIAMESTGVYWMPVWNVLDGYGFELLLVNPAQVKALQGRKSDQRDAQRIAEFLQDRRLDRSFVPPREIRQLKQMLRHRQSLLEQRNDGSTLLQPESVSQDTQLKAFRLQVQRSSKAIAIQGPLPEIDPGF